MLTHVISALCRATTAQTIVMAVWIAMASFIIGQEYVAEAAQGPCDTQCEYIHCRTDGPPVGGCGNCGEWAEFTDFFNAGKNCISCGVGWCRFREKVDIDHCAICEERVISQCLSCVI